jgi:Coenzyme PQQ synthesis protein D (PqqD)
MSAATGDAGVTISKTALGSFRKSGNVVSRVVANEAIVVPIRRGAADLDSIFTFNEAGTALWAMVEANRSSREMSEFLEREYGLSAEQAEADTQVFIENLAAAGLVETV